MAQENAWLEFWEVLDPRSRERESIFVVHHGPPQAGGALVLHRPTGTWLYSPTVVHQSLMTDLDEDQQAIDRVTRARAAEVARELGTTLPTDAELVDLMARAAADPDRRAYPRRPTGPTPA